MQDRWDGMRWMWYGLGAMFVLIGAAVVVGVFYRVPIQTTGTPAITMDFSWVWNIVGVFFLLWLLGIFFGWGWGWRWRGHHYWRHDDAYHILRERYAKGEITKEQFEQMMKDLEAHEP